MSKRKLRSVNAARRNTLRTGQRFELLEPRWVMAVTADLSSGLLEIRLDADKDAAAITVQGGSVRVSDGATIQEFRATDVTGIRAISDSGELQSISFADSLAANGALDVSGIATVAFVQGEYSFGTVSVVAGEAISFDQFSLTATGDISLKAEQTVTEAEAGLLGFLGVGAEAETSIKLTDSLLKGGGNVEIIVTNTLEANADGDDDEDINRDFARVKAASSATVSLVGRTAIAADGDVTIQAESVVTVSAVGLAKGTSVDATKDAVLALTNVTTQRAGHD